MQPQVGNGDPSFVIVPTENDVENGRCRLAQLPSIPGQLPLQSSALVAAPEVLGDFKLLERIRNLAQVSRQVRRGCTYGLKGRSATLELDQADTRPKTLHVLPACSCP